MVEVIEIPRESAVACYQVFQTAASQVSPHRTMEQDVTAEEDPVGTVEQADVIRSLARGVDDLQVPPTEIDPVAIA